MGDSPVSEQWTEESLDISAPSTPGTPIEPFTAAYKVKVLNPVKDGPLVTFKVYSFKIANKEEAYKVTRTFDDFAYLHHQLTVNSNIDGIVIPPLPSRPIVEAKGAQDRSKQQLGFKSKLVIRDEFAADCKGLEMYLRFLLVHPLFGENKILETFLTDQVPPVRAIIKQGKLAKLSSALQESRIANHRDIDEYFQKQRDWTNHYANMLRIISDNFNTVIFSTKRIAASYAMASTALSLAGSYEERHNKRMKTVLVKFSEVLDDVKHGTEVDTVNDENTLGFHLDLAARYAEALKDMLYRRTCLLVEYEDANKTLAKAKPHKKQEAQDSKCKIEMRLEACSETARREIIAFNRQQLLIYQGALSVYAEAKVKTARDTYALLTKSLADIKKTTF